MNRGVRFVKRFIVVLLYAVVGLALSLGLLLNIPSVQQWVGGVVEGVLTAELGAEVRVGSVDVGMLNKIVIDDVKINDRTGEECFAINRLACKFSLYDLLYGDINIYAAQIYGLRAGIYRASKGQPLNIQFIIDKLASKDEDKEPSRINIDISHLTLRRGTVKYDVLDEPRKGEGVFDVNHIGLTNVSTLVALNVHKDAPAQVHITKTTLNEASGFRVVDSDVMIDGSNIIVKSLKLPNSNVAGMACLVAGDVSISLDSATFVAPIDLVPLVPVFTSLSQPFKVAGQAVMKNGNLNVDDLAITMGNDFALQLRLAGEQIEDSINRRVETYATLRAAPAATKQLLGLLPAGVRQYMPTDLTVDVAATLENSIAAVDVKANTNRGNISTHALADIADRRNVSIKSQTTIDELRMDTLSIGKVSGSLANNITLRDGKLRRVTADGTLHSFAYNNYTYKNASIRAEYAPDVEASVTLALNDPNAMFDLTVTAVSATRKQEATYKVEGHVERINLARLNFSKEAFAQADYAFDLSTDLRGNSLEEITGNIDLTNLRAAGRTGINYPPAEIHVMLEGTAEDRHISINSSYFDFDVQGQFTYATLPASIERIARPYIPSLFAPVAATQRSEDSYNNSLNFMLVIHNADSITSLMNVPVHLAQGSAIVGSLSDADREMQLLATFPSIRYKNNTFNGLRIEFQGYENRLDGTLGGNLVLADKSTVDTELRLTANDGKLTTSLAWSDNNMRANEGKLELMASFLKNETNGLMQASINILPSTITLSDTTWQVAETQINIDSLLHINGFNVSSGQQSITANGAVPVKPTVGDAPANLLEVSLTNAELGYLLSFIKLYDPAFAGAATGTVRIVDDPAGLQVLADIDVDEFKLNNALLGDLHAKGTFATAHDSIVINATATNQAGKATNIRGHISPKAQALDLRFDANETNVAFLEPYFKGILSGLSGATNGRYRLFGTFKTIQVEGNGMLNAQLNVDVSGVRYAIQDSIRITPTSITLNNASISDTQRHPGRITARITHRFFKDFRYDIAIQSSGMQLMNIRNSTDLPFNGVVYGSGDVRLAGGPGGLNISGMLSTDANSVFNYQLVSASPAATKNFITFVEPESDAATAAVKSANGQSGRNGQNGTPPPATAIIADVRININPSTEINVTVDPASGDYITCTGSSTPMRIQYNSNGDIQLNGKYTVQEGTYKFSLQNVVHRDFDVREGSSVSFNGTADRATCDIKASHTVNSVSIRDLGNDVANIVKTSQTNVRVNCILNISGNLATPALNFDIELPNENTEAARLVRNYINAEDQMSTQIVYLLGIGKFYTPDYANRNTTTSNAMTSVAASTISGQLNDIFSQLINSKQWNFGVTGSTGEEGWTDMEVQGMLSGNLLNNKLLINGNLGYRDNSTTNANQSNFIGDFDVEYLLTRSGNIRLKAYNKSNDRYSTRTNLNTQGIGILFRKDFD